MKLSFHDQFNLKMILIKIVVDVSSVLDILCNGFEVLKSVKSKKIHPSFIASITNI